MGYRTHEVGDRKWVDGVEYVFSDGRGWLATGESAPGITNTPRAGEPMDTPIRSALEGSPRLPTDSAERKGMPVFSGVIRYFPDALAEVARLSMTGNEKHNPGQPLHWSRGKSTDHLDCIARHMHEAGTIDTDGILHDAKIAWRALANLQVTLERVRGLPISPGSKP